MRFFIFPVALLVSNIALAATPINGWYASVFGGYTYLPNNINVTQSGLTRTDASYEAGYDAGGNLGYKSYPLRYEGELTYLNANLDGFRVNNTRQTGVDGYSNGILAMANVFYDFPGLISSIDPYLGVGIGYAWVKAELDSTGPNGSTAYTGTNNVFAYQVHAGLTYNFAENYALSIGYRYVGTQEPDHLGKIFQANMANLTATYRFNGAGYK